MPFRRRTMQRLGQCITYPQLVVNHRPGAFTALEKAGLVEIITEVDETDPRISARVVHATEKGRIAHRDYIRKTSKQQAMPSRQTSRGEPCRFDGQPFHSKTAAASYAGVSLSTIIRWLDNGWDTVAKAKANDKRRRFHR